jgi:hypothetical protein
MTNTSMSRFPPTSGTTKSPIEQVSDANFGVMAKIEKSQTLGFRYLFLSHLTNIVKLVKDVSAI